MIFVYDNNLTALGVINNYKSFEYKRQLRNVGNFKIEIAYNKTNAEFLQVGNIVDLDGASGIIVESVLKQDVSGQVLMVQGTTLLGLLNQRITALYTATGTSETLAKTIVSDNCVSATDTNRNFANLSVVADALNGTSQDVSTENKPLIKELEKILSIDNYGHKVYIDNGLNYDTIIGVDRTESVQFSNNIHNLKVAEEQVSDANHKTFVYIDGNAVSSTYGTAAGYDRREVYINDTKLTTVNELNDRAAQDLNSKYAKANNIKATIRIAGNPFIYKTDYDLGDFVTVVIGSTVYNVQITETTERYSEAGKEVLLTLGTPQRTVSEIITDIKTEQQ